MPLSPDDIDQKVEQLRALAQAGAKAEAADAQIVQAMNLGFDLLKQALRDLRTIAETVK